MEVCRGAGAGAAGAGFGGRLASRSRRSCAHKALPDGEGPAGEGGVTVAGAGFARLAGLSSSESDDAISNGASGLPVPPVMRGGSSTSTSITSGEEGEAIYNFSKHSASDDAGVSVFRPYQDPAPWMQETVNRFATVDLAKAEHFLVCLTHASKLGSAFGRGRAGHPREGWEARCRSPRSV